MDHDYTKTNQLIGWLLLIMAVCFSCDLIIISGSVTSAVNTVNAATTAQIRQDNPVTGQEKEKLDEALADLLLCGQWPKDVRLSEGRGNPFEPKNNLIQPLFMNYENTQPIEPLANPCRTAREALINN